MKYELRMAINSPKTCILALAARIIIWGLKIRDEIASDVGLKKTMVIDKERRNEILNKSRTI